MSPKSNSSSSASCSSRGGRFPPSAGRGRGGGDRPSPGSVGWIPDPNSRGGPVLMKDPRSDYKECVRKGALWRRLRGKSSLPIEPEGFDRIDNDTTNTYKSLPTTEVHYELLARRALKAYEDYHLEQYKFVSLEKAAKKKKTANYYLTFTVTAKNDDVVKTLQAIVRNVYYKYASVLYVKMIPAIPSTELKPAAS